MEYSDDKYGNLHNQMGNIERVPINGNGGERPLNKYLRRIGEATNPGP